MSGLTTATTLSGSTIAGTGGTTVTWASLGQVGNKVTLVVPADADLRTRRQIDVVAKQPTPRSGTPNGYTQARVTKVYKRPLTLDNGETTVNTVKVEVSYDVETNATEIQDLLDVGAQMLFDSDFTGVDTTLALT